VPVFGGFERQLVEHHTGRRVSPTFDVRREDPCSLALTLRLVRRLRGIKQAHAGELLGVTQSTVSRIERGELKPAGALRNRLLDLVVARIDPSRDAALRHLVEARPVRSIWSAISPIGCWPRPVRASANGDAANELQGQSRPPAAHPAQPRGRWRHLGGL
jgi:transcriptional regulator with XRE-family HTH domain